MQTPLCDICSKYLNYTWSCNCQLIVQNSPELLSDKSTGWLLQLKNQTNATRILPFCLSAHSNITSILSITDLL